MRVPVLLLILSLSVLLAAVSLPGMDDWVLLAGPCVLACLILLVRARLAPGAPIAEDRQPARPPGFRPPRIAGARWVLIDGSNVMHWKDNTPQIDTLRQVIGQLTARGFSPAVVFDANAGYLIAGKYQHDKAFGDLLGLPADRLMVVPKGEPADPVLLAAARDIGAQIVTNDRYRDWVEAYPELRNPDVLVRGGYRDGRLWLDLQEVAVA